MSRMESIRDSVSIGLQKAGSAVGLETKSSQDSDALDELSDLCPKLSYQQVRSSLPASLSSVDKIFEPGPSDLPSLTFCGWARSYSPDGNDWTTKPVIEAEVCLKILLVLIAVDDPCMCV
mmetsp:Transcript_14636/g.42902  ORF Transcript_14636/g.42902 Transcript_14636/m.42902 type:complete len:120 (+) Transcript_14636:70-429(+)